MSGRLPLSLRQFCLGCGIGHVGDLPGHEADNWMQMQGNIQKNPGMPDVNSGNLAAAVIDMEKWESLPGNRKTGRDFWL